MELLKKTKYRTVLNFMTFQSKFKLISSFMLIIFTVSFLQGQSCDEYLDQMNMEVQDIITDAGTSNVIYDVYSTSDTCVWTVENWANGVDFSGIAFDNNRAGTLISPRHILMATHYQRSIGSTLIFHDSLGNIHTAILTAKQSIPGGTNPDITIGLLDVDVPVKYYRVLVPKDNWIECLDGALAISTHHNRIASIREVSGIGGSYINFNQSSAVPTSFYAPVVSGNSGNPSFLIINGEPILISTFSFSNGTGPFFSSTTNFAAIDSLMTVLGGGYQLETNGVDEDEDGFYAFEDCDDTNSLVNPGQIEIEFNGLDDDCDPSTLDHDEDNDGFSLEDDCDDQNSDIYPGSVEVLNNLLDDDCDGWIDEPDADGDGFLSDIDCDDNNPYAYPGAAEIPNNGIDDNCDGEEVDIESCNTFTSGAFTTFMNAVENCENPYTAGFEVWTNESYRVNNLNEDKTYFFDFCEGYDSDIWEAVITVYALPTFWNSVILDEVGYIITANVDCRVEFKHSNPDEFPNVLIIISNRLDCTGLTEQIDNGIPTFGCLDGEQDEDQDGFTANEECDDTNPSVNPSASEIPYNGLDDDCNPMTLDNDLDQDGFVNVIDCDDNNVEVNPAMNEVPYNGLDDDCDPLTLDDDLDQDGFVLADDCDDENMNIYPGATEILDNDIDEDCDGLDLLSSIYELANYPVQLFPNPTMDLINIDINGNLFYHVELYDLLGKLILNESNANVLSLNHLPPGTYLLKIQDVNSTDFIIEKIIKQN